VPSATIVGAGVFGAWTAFALHTRGWTVTLIEQYGPANSRASSGGETRIIRSGYGGHAIYASWAHDALPRWQALERETRVSLFTRTGALFVGRDESWLRRTLDTLQREQVAAEWLTPAELGERYAPLHFTDAAGGVFEPEAGVLFARRAVQTLVRLLRARGVTIVQSRVTVADLLRGSTGDAIVLAAGPWLPALLPDLLGDFIVPTRQEVFFFGAPAGSPPAQRFAPEQFPAWVAFDEGIYGLPDLEHRGVKIAIDAHGPRVDPETLDRVVDAGAIARIREVLRRRIPSLADAPLLESRVCQYENTPDGHFLLDRLPGQDRVWIAGGGSGHGFKHGPSIGEYVADLIEARRAPDPMFGLTGRSSRARAVY
jgi:monomeric sarcosine oxidase